MSIPPTPRPCPSTTAEGAAAPAGPGPTPDRSGSALDGGARPRGREVRRGDRIWAAAIGVAAAAAIAAAWYGQRRMTSVVHDEFAYLLQARTFLQGKLTLPRPPLPEFFEAIQVLVEPVYAAKYPPGHALFLAPFVALGLPWLGPCLAFGAIAALLFLGLRNEGCSRPIALFAAAVFAAAADSLLLFGTYLSHSSSTLCAVATIYALRHPSLPSMRRVGLAGVFVGYALLTRPYTAAALAVPGLLWLLSVERKAAHAAAAAVPILAAAALLLAFNARVTGHPLRSPWQVWAQQYTPFDGPGIGEVAPDLRRERLAPHLQHVHDIYWRTRARYTADRLPGQAAARLREALETVLPSAELALLAIPGALLCWRRKFAGFGLAFAGALFLMQMSFHASLKQYYLELSFGLAAAVALGVEWLAARPRSGRPLSRRLIALGALGLTLFAAYAHFLPPARLETAVLVLSLAAATAGLAVPRLSGRALLASCSAAALGVGLPVAGALHSAQELRYLAIRLDGDVDLQTRFEQARQAVARERGVLFVRYRTTDPTHVDTTNPFVDLKDAPVVVALDRGEDNARLRSLLGPRPAFHFDVESRKLERLP